ncbi:MAG: hypothetical protein Q9219_004849 [cf. Caloplaca sp. 3 TL-2023]
MAPPFVRFLLARKMESPDERSPLLHETSRSPGSKDLEASTVRKNHSSRPDESNNVPNGTATRNSTPDGRIYLILGMLMLSIATPSSGNAIVPSSLNYLSTGVFMSSLDNSLVIVTSSIIASEFNSLENADWLLTSYLVAVCATQPIYGKLSDIYGRKVVLISAYTIFTVGCAIWSVPSFVI